MSFSFLEKRKNCFIFARKTAVLFDFCSFFLLLCSCSDFKKSRKCLEKQKILKENSEIFFESRKLRKEQKVAFLALFDEL